MTSANPIELEPQVPNPNGSEPTNFTDGFTEGSTGGSNDGSTGGRTGATSPDGSPIPPIPPARPPAGVSERKREANRANSHHSTGPRSSMGKRLSSLNSFKTGYYSRERRLELMGELEEDPKLRERRRQDLYASYPPGSPVEAMLLDDLADHWYKRDQLDRLDAALKLRELEAADRDDLRREELQQDLTPAATTAEVIKVGLARIPDSAGKFENILNLLGAVLGLAESGELGPEHWHLWQQVYGMKESNWYANGVFDRMDHARKGEKVDCEGIIALVKRELDFYAHAQARYLAEHDPQTEAEREARLVSCSGDGLIVFKMMESADRQIERKLQLLLKVRKERQRAEQGTGGRGQGTGDRKQGTGDRKQGTGNRRRGTEKQVAKGKSEDAASVAEEPGLGTGDSGLGEETPPATCSESSETRTPNPGPIPSSRPESPVPSPVSANPEPRIPNPGPSATNDGQGTTDSSSANPESLTPNPGPIDPQLSTFLKNEATDLLENKGSASAETRNEATVDEQGSPSRKGGSFPQVTAAKPLPVIIQTTLAG